MKIDWRQQRVSKQPKYYEIKILVSDVFVTRYRSTFNPRYCNAVRTLHKKQKDF